MRAKFLLALMFFISSVAHAQYFGAGVYGGVSACPWPYEEGDGAEDESDTIHELRKKRREINSDLKEARDKQNKVKREKSAAQRKIAKVITGDALQTVTAHMTVPNSKGSYSESCTMAGGFVEGDSGYTAENFLGGSANSVATAPASSVLTYSDGFCFPTQADSSKSINIFHKKYAGDNGVVHSQLCYVPRGPFIKPGATSDQRSDCAEALEDFREAAEEERELGSQIAGLKSDLKAYDDMIEDEQDRLREARRNGDDDDEDTEGEYCFTCRQGKGPSTLETIAGIGMNVLGGVLAYKGAKYAIDQNSRLGWPTSPYLAAQMGYPFLMNGLYGVMGGGIGMGGFGCAGGAYGGGFPYGPFGMMNGGLYGGAGGAFGYPQGMFGNPAYGGLMMPGGYPGGGFPGYGFPGGFMINGGIGLMMPGYMMPGMAGMAGMAGVPGMPGYMMPGYMMPGYAGMAGMAGIPGMPGFMINGGIGLMMPGYMMPGYAGMAGMAGIPGMPGMAGMAGMAGIPGMPGMAGMAGMAGIPGMPGMAGMAGMAGMDYQAQMMQQYMSQMQQYMAYQQRQQQDYFSRQQSVMALQQEIYRIQMQIYTISSGSLGAPSILPVQQGPGNFGPGGQPNSGGMVIDSR